MVDKAVAALPAPEKGDKGLGVKDLLIDREGQLVATFDDGSTKALGRVVGKDGESLPVDPEQLAGVVRVEVEKAVAALPAPETVERSEEHTSELQSLMRISYAVFCLKTKQTTRNKHIPSKEY